METQEFFREWKEKYPKIFDEFFQFLDNYFFEKIGKALFSFRENDNGSFDIMLDEYELPFEMLTGIIEKFFEENNIEIDILIFFHNGGFSFELCKNNKNIIQSDFEYETKTESQMSAYLKAAEMLEKELG